ncbi:hypothetical protein BGX23_004272 [Mortierella sp. AD031]|nr:hypothetical protein BGX23_004272 [Mortierella sp. AD031]
MSDNLFVCAHDAVRSQIAAALFTKHKTQPGIKAISAGLTPAPEIPTFVLETMSEIGLDLVSIQPIKITRDYKEHWHNRDFGTMPKEDARALRNGIKAKFKEFIVENGY